MSQGSNPGHDQQEPPSFVPTGRPRSQTGRIPSRTGTGDLPSFSPSARSHHGVNHPSGQRVSQTSQEARPAHAPRRSSGSSRTAPVSSRQMVAGRPRASSGLPRERAASPGRFSSPGGSAAKVRSRHPLRHFLVGLLVVLLAAAVILAGWMWTWVGRQLNHENMLTGAPASSASTWLILGSDQRDGTPGTGNVGDAPGFRTDTILVLTQPKHGASSLISIPRDSLVKVKGSDMKINAAANLAGYPALTEQVEAITGHKIDHVVMIRFGGLEQVVDAIGGVNLCYDRTVNDVRSGMNWTAGCHDADGGTALAFSRMRYSDPKGDFGRAERQRQVIGAITKKAFTPSVLLSPSRATKLISTALKSVLVDESANPWTVMRMALAFRKASGGQGVTGSVYWSNPDYRPGNVGSSVLLDAAKNTELFQQLDQGSHEPGVVGGQSGR